mmetsp:Transcript_30795/g.60266  ORF Transcript_30795/g.60266 Transcript_30795/m.60266 type:complete len:100 (-) Transcript_30795:104-403(-)
MQWLRAMHRASNEMKKRSCDTLNCAMIVCAAPLCSFCIYRSICIPTSRYRELLNWWSVMQLELRWQTKCRSELPSVTMGLVHLHGGRDGEKISKAQDNP